MQKKPYEAPPSVYEKYRHTPAILRPLGRRRRRQVVVLVHLGALLLYGSLTMLAELVGVAGRQQLHMSIAGLAGSFLGAMLLFLGTSQLQRNPRIAAMGAPIRPWTGGLKPALDERELAARAEAVSFAFSLTQGALLAAGGYLAAAGWFRWWLPTSPSQALPLLLCFTMVTGYIPLTLIAWREPDADA